MKIQSAGLAPRHGRLGLCKPASTTEVCKAGMMDIGRGEIANSREKGQRSHGQLSRRVPCSSELKDSWAWCLCACTGSQGMLRGNQLDGSGAKAVTKVMAFACLVSDPSATGQDGRRAGLLMEGGQGYGLVWTGWRATACTCSSRASNPWTGIGRLLSG